MPEDNSVLGIGPLPVDPSVVQETIQELGPTHEARKARAACVAQGFIDYWAEDRSLVIAAIMEATGLTRVETMLMIVLNDLGIIRDIAASALRHMEYDPRCEHCRRHKAIEERQLALMEKTERHIDEEHGGDDWKQPDA